MPPAAISPEAYRLPGEISLSVSSAGVTLVGTGRPVAGSITSGLAAASLAACCSMARSTIQRITPPTKMASVVAMERYAPTANVSERTPSSSTTITSATPSSTSVHGNLRERMPLMTVAIRRPCGAAARSLPIP